MESKKEKITFKQRIKLLLQSAKKRNIYVNLNEWAYKSLFNSGCLYCGDALHDQGGYCLDRWDNTKGYTIDNISPACKRCNQAKGKMTMNEYMQWIEKSYKFQKKKSKEINDSIIEQFDSTNKYRVAYRKTVNKAQNCRKYRNSQFIKYDGERGRE